MKFSIPALFIGTLLTLGSCQLNLGGRKLYRNYFTGTTFTGETILYQRGANGKARVVIPQKIVSISMMDSVIMIAQVVDQDSNYYVIDVHAHGRKGDVLFGPYSSSLYSQIWPSFYPKSSGQSDINIR